MTLPSNRPNNEVVLNESTTSIATTPVVVTAIVPTNGYVKRVFAGAGGTFTGSITTTVTINGGSDIAGGALVLPAQTGAVPGVGVHLNLVGAGTTSGVWVNEGDVITFTPSGGTGASIPGAFALVIRKDA